VLKRSGFQLLPGTSIFAMNLGIQLQDWWKVVVSLTLFNSMPVINGLMATAGARAGGLAILNYGKKIVTLPNDIGALTYSIVLLPHMSRLAAAKEWDSLLRLLNKWLVVILTTTLPAVLLLFFLSDFIVETLYQRGAFSADDTVNVTIVLRYYVLQIPFFIAFYIMVRLLSVIQKTGATLYFAILGFVLTVLINLLFIDLLGVY
jgi:peptidoglycan biosynthesis protein MviN/MurJ (putative lipid II flippase)